MDVMTAPQARLAALDAGRRKYKSRWALLIRNRR
jgi:hypothetical protein